MLKLSALLFLSAILSCSVISARQPLKLRHVTVLYRHGDRNPISLVPNDRPENAAWTWRNGLGGLTRVGMQQHFEFGRWLAKRYRRENAASSTTASLLSSDYNYTEIYVRSSNNDRCLQSAQSNLAGFYADTATGRLSNLVPIHAHTETNDHLLEMTSSCSRIHTILQQLAKDPAVRRRYAPFQPTLDILRIHSGLGPDLQFNETSYVHDSMLIEKLKGRRWPEFMTDELFANLTVLSRMNWQLMFKGTPELTRLTGGFLVSTILANMHAVMSGHAPIHNEFERPTGSKLIVYSAHDTDVSAASAVLANLLVLPPYASGLMFELWQATESTFITSSSAWAVRVAYRNHTNQTEPAYLKAPGCASVMCPMDVFIRGIRSNLAPMNEFDKLCANTPRQQSDSDENICKFLSTDILIDMVLLSLIFYLMVMIKIQSEKSKASKCTEIV